MRNVSEACQQKIVREIPAHPVCSSLYSEDLGFFPHPNTYRVAAIPCLATHELHDLEARRLDVFGLHGQDPVGRVLRLLPVLHAQLELHLLHQRRRELLVDDNEGA